MRRSIVIALACVGMVGLSCQLPQLTAAPRQDALIGEPKAETIAGDALARTEIEQQILGDLRRRHTALSDRDLIALAAAIVDEAALRGLDPELVLAVIQVESGGYHLAVSPVGAMGLMQLLPTTAEELAAKLGVEWRGPDSLFDPLFNVKLGTAYLRQLSDRYDHMPTALAAYNWGPGRIDRRLRRGASVPGRYTRQVMKAYGERESTATRRSS